MPTTARKKPPSGKKLITLHLDGMAANVGMAEFVHDVMFAVGNRSQDNTEHRDNGSPTMHVNAAGELVVYVRDWSV